jgi:aarF domain-containing kinase
VHRAVLHDGTHVAVKVQYPGVAESIDSDINNLLSLLNMTGLVPKGLYVERVLEVAKKELTWECDYEREADCSERFATLVYGALFPTGMYTLGCR